MEGSPSFSDSTTRLAIDFRHINDAEPSGLRHATMPSSVKKLTMASMSVL